MVAGGDFFVDDFAMGHVYAFGAVELYSVFAAVEFGGFHGQFAIGGDDGQFAVAAGVYAFVFAPVVVVVVARVFFVEGLFVDKFCTQVGFFALDEGGAVATGKAGKQNPQQHRYRTQAVLTLCRFCAVDHGKRNECGHYACYFTSNGVVTGFRAKKIPLSYGGFFCFRQDESVGFGHCACFVA